MRSSRFTHVSLGSLEDKIQLSGRQLELLEQRRQRLDGTNGVVVVEPKRNGLPSRPPTVSSSYKYADPVKPSAGAAVKNASWDPTGLEASHTAPTTSWGSSDSEVTASGSTTRNTNHKSTIANANPETAQKALFYGQQGGGASGPKPPVTKAKKKLYDDEGASYYESMSEASALLLSQKKLEMASTALTETLTKSSSSGGNSTSNSSHHQEASSSSRLTAEVKKSRSHESEAASQAPSTKESVKESNASHKGIDLKAHLKKRLLANMAEKRKDQGKPAVSAHDSHDKAKDRRQSLGLNRPKKNVPAGEDHQRAFLRTLMQSAYKPKQEEPPPQKAKQSSKDTRLSFSARESAANSATRSGTTSSSAASAEDKAIMRKVLERSRRKKTPTSNTNPPRKQNFVKSSTSRMKKMLTPRSSPRNSPRSGTSDESANDERSYTEQPRRSSPRMISRNSGRKTPRREKTHRSSPRLLKAVSSRWSGAGSRADDEAESPKQHQQAITQDISESTTEEMVSDMSNSEKLDLKSTMSSDEEKASSAVEIKRQATNVSAQSRQSFRELTDETPIHLRLRENLSFDEDCSNRYSLVSRPSILNDHEIEVEVKGSHARAVTESLMEPIDLDSPKLHPNDQFRNSPKANIPRMIPESEEFDTTTNAVDEEEPEGYAEFVATLKAEVAGSHSLLWESFHGLFHENEAAPPLSDQEGTRFDAKTKDLVTNMSTYLKRNHTVTCTTGAQLANDKTVRENPVSTPVFGQHLLKSTRDSPHGSVGSRSSFDDDFDSDKENQGGGLTQVPSIDASSINGEDVDSNEIEVTLGQFARKNSKATVPEKSRPVIKPLVNKSVTKANTFKPIVEPQVTPKSGASNSTAPWSGVKLRSVADANKSEVSNSTIPTSWAKVKLRPVSTKSENTKQPEGSEAAGGGRYDFEEEDDSSNFRRILVSKKKPGSETPAKRDTPKKTDEPELIEIIDLANAPSTEDNPIDLANAPSNEDDPIDLTAKSNEDMPIDLTCAATPRTTTDMQSRADTKATTMTADGSVLVSLAPEPNSEPVKILIGKKGLVKICSKPGETKARVVWRLDLDDVRSALLDLASFKVKLLLDSSEDNKDLTFSTSEQCMRFANALHELTTSSSADETVEAMSLAEESVFVEQLNEEEQRVLEEFRQSKKEAGCRLPPFPSIDTSTSEKPMSVINAHSSGLSSPLSEISGPGSALSSADLRVAQSYQKMLRMGIPKEAVRHKMDKDDVSSKIVDFVLGAEAGDPTDEGVSAGETLGSKEELIAATYKRMLKMRIPPEAVRHKMEKEGVDDKIVRYVLGEGAPKPEEPQEEIKKSSGPTLSADEEKVASSYRKMLKMMIPKEAVEHKMQKDQVDPKIIAAVVGAPPKSESAPKQPSVPNLTDEEESVASSYRKMLGLRIPKEAVRKKMESEGISKKVIASVLGEKLKDEDTKKGRVKKGKQGFHWKPLVSSENLKNSVWSKASFDSGFLDDDATISSHVEQFQKKPESDDASRVTAKSASSSKDKAKLIDLGRANNLAITLKAFSEIPQDELAQIIEFVDPFEKIKGDRALFMKDLLPASAEIKVIKSYEGDENRLVPAEKWFRRIVDIKRIEEKIHVLRTMESFRNEAISLGESFQRLTNVCNQVMSSEKLPDLLEMVRQIGNRMNDDRGQEAAGFKLDFLPRLAQTKGSDKKTTALDLVVMIFNQRGHRAALLLSDDFPECYEVSRMQLGEMLSDVNMLSGAMRKCQSELNSLQKEAGKSRRTRPAIPSDSHSESGMDKSKGNKSTRSSADDEVHTDVSSMHEEMFSKRAALINSVLNKGKREDQIAPSNGQVRQQTKAQDGESKSPRARLQTFQAKNEKAYSHLGAINRIERFMEEAQIIYHELETNRDKAVASCKELTEFFCESGGERIAPTLLGILSEFSSNLNSALSKYDQQQKAEARKKASKEKNDQTNKASVSAKSTTRTTRSTHHEKKSLVLMVNEMLKVAGDKQKADFMKGVTYERPDSRLKQIYEVEKQLGKPVGSPATARRNILRSIEERRHLHGSHDSDAALSALAMAMQSRTPSNDSMSPTARTLDSGDSFSCSEASSNKEHFELTLDEEACPQSSRRKSQRMSIAERWTRKTADQEEEESIDEDFVFQIRKTDSQILASDSHDSEDRKYEEKKRQEYMSRWANQHALLKADDNNDNGLENESDVGARTEYRSKTRQQYMSRWASKPTND